MVYYNYTIHSITIKGVKMSKIVEGLVSTLFALSREDKSEAVKLLIEDAEFRIAISNVLVERLIGNEEILSTSKRNPPQTQHFTPRETGNRVREAYLSHLRDKGILISFSNKTWAKTSSGLFLTMPFANEQQPHGWFLGTVEIDLINNIKCGKAAIILLCQSREGPMMDFVIPPFKVEEITPYLSKSKGQLKFNVRKVESKYYLALTGRNPLDITDYIGKISILR
jgi:hypothetical protein